MLCARSEGSPVVCAGHVLRSTSVSQVHLGARKTHQVFPLPRDWDSHPISIGCFSWLFPGEFPGNAYARNLVSGPPSTSCTVHFVFGWSSDLLVLVNYGFL